MIGRTVSHLWKPERVLFCPAGVDHHRKRKADDLLKPLWRVAEPMDSMDPDRPLAFDSLFTPSESRQ
jgi:hypothetical protein